MQFNISGKVGNFAAMKTQDCTTNSSDRISICKPLFHLLSDKLKFTGVVMDNPHHVTLPQGLTCLLGSNGSGKTSLANIIERGRNFMTNRITTEFDYWPRIRSISFTDIHSLTGFKVEYYQQRFESTMNDEVLTVAELLGEKVNSNLYMQLSESFSLHDVLDKKVNYLSSGELRKLLIINTLFELPEVLILDNPFIGLDSTSKQVVEKALEQIVESGVNVILLLADICDIPKGVTAVVPIKDMSIGEVIFKNEEEDVETFRKRVSPVLQDKKEDKDKDEDSDSESHLLSRIIDSEKTFLNPDQEPEEIVRLTDCKVCYGKQILLEHVNWSIRQGECWALSGPNGSGKSTLLSLINADNPQAYSNDIVLFGRKRGTGESIWDIKNRIGYVSAELHLNFRGWNDTLNYVIAQGMRNALNRFVPLTQEEQNRIKLWLEYFNLSHLSEVPFNNLSSGQQRLALVIRAIIRQPQLIVLDEPMHGLDEASKKKVNQVVELLSSIGTSIIFVTHNPEELPHCVIYHKRLSKL